MKVGDIDIDVKSHTDKDKYGVRAIIYDPEKKEVRPHPSGYYYDDNIPVDKITGNASIDHKEAESLGYQKVDLLTNTAYDSFKTKQEVLDCINREPDWNLLKDESFVKHLPHIGNHFDLVNQISPISIDELADVLALIRPGKKHLLEAYLKNKERTRLNLYRKPKKGFYFKRSHSIAYSIQIVCLMNKKNVKGLLKWG